MASNWQLPALYVVENNGFGEFTPTDYVIQVENIAERARSYAMRADIADGMDFFDVYAKAGEAIERARRGEGPTLLECKTYRFKGHYVGDPLRYRGKEEAERWMQTRDPLQLFERRVLEDSLLETDALRQLDGEVAEELRLAVEAAEGDPLPDPSEVLTDVYARA
jgi:pyruvate dehydrogenase E1 component alpha subunit